MPASANFDSKSNRRIRKTALLAIPTALSVILLIEGSSEVDLLAIAYFLILLVGLAVLLITALVRRSRTLASFAFLWLLMTFLAYLNSSAIHEHELWLLSSRSYKAQLQANAVPASNGLLYMEWYGWGFPGAGSTTVYLVQDPSDTLGGKGRTSLLPCDVWRVRRLERGWYAVTFFTDQIWTECDAHAPKH